MTKRDAVLNGTIKATELHKQMGLKQALADGQAPIDVLSVMHHLGLAVIFRPLEGLLGAYLPLPGLAGIIITTKRPLQVQRFTAAHELGHYMFQHVVSTDKEVGFAARSSARKYDPQEVEADAFASEFLMPVWLIAAHVRRQGWTMRELQQQPYVYQLSLRLGVSYEALCWALQGHKLISPEIGDDLRAREVKAAKQVAAGDVKPASWWADVWTVREQDNGATLLGGPEDLLVLNLKEHTTAGYRWDLSAAEKLGLTIKQDTQMPVPPLEIGAVPTRRATLQGGVEGTLLLEQRRGWEARGNAAASLSFQLSLHGKESSGLPRVARLKQA